MTDLRPYPEYRSSGVPWLGSVPKHWATPSLGQVGTLTKGTGGNKEDELPTGIPCVRYGDLYTTHKHFIEHTRSFIPLEVADRYTEIVFGDVLFAASGETIEEIGKSAVNLIRKPAYCGGDIILFRPRGSLLPRYAGYVMDCRPVANQKATMGRGFTVHHIYGKQLKYLRIPVPPREEQNAIVHYLDSADQRIRDYVSAKERLITLLQEERQAIVHQAVTRGLDPNVRLKPSGVEWLGDVPEHWEITQFARQVSIAEGQVDPKTEPYASMVMIAPNHVESGTGKLLSTETASEQGAISSKYLCRAGDVIYSKIRPALAKVAVTHTNCLCSADMYPLRPRHPLQSDYLFWLLLSTGFTAWSVLQSDRVAMPKINRQTLNNVHIPFPPISEQDSIVQHLIEATTKASGAIGHARRQIELMEEYRTRLIADAVTGKIDVRDTSPQSRKP